MAALDQALAPATSADDAARAAAQQARAAGVVGVLAQSRAAFLGDVQVDASEVVDRGAIALDAGDRASAPGASHGRVDGNGSDGNASGGGSNGDGDGGVGDGNASGGNADVGSLQGDEVGEAYGAGGLGLVGSGRGGGGAGDGSVGLGDLGTIGLGGGDGSGYGYARGAGGLGCRRAQIVDVVPGSAQVRGACDRDIIRRVVRAHVNEVRFCYERVLQAQPTLLGRSVTHFLIEGDGRVSLSAAAGMPEVDACLAAAIRRWQFPSACAANVTYPFTFVTEGATRTAP
jgi:hypothetical protein